MTGLPDWAITLANVLEQNPGAKWVSVGFADGGRLHVTRDSAQFIAMGEIVDVDDALGGEVFEVVP